MAQGFIIVLVLFVVAYIYYTIKEKAKRNLFFKEQYEQQKTFTHQYSVYTTTASQEQIRESVKRHINIDDSAKSSFLGGTYTVSEETAQKLALRHRSKITTGGEGDEFTGSLTFSGVENGNRVTVQIERWREKDGVTRKSGIEAMQEFMNQIDKAIRAVDPDVKVEKKQKQGGK